MRGKERPATETYESSFATTVLPEKVSRRDRKRTASADGSPPALAPVAPEAHKPGQNPAQKSHADYPIEYPNAPGFPPQPHYAGGRR